MDFQKKNWQFRDLIAEGELNRMEDGIEEGITKAEQAQGTADNAQDAINNHIAATTGVHGATSAATPNTIVQRDASGRFKAAAPAASDDVARKAETDAAMAAAQAAHAKADAALPKAGGIVDGTLLVNGNGGISHFNWLTMSSAGTGDVLYGQNCYIDTQTGQYKFKNTHDSMGARGIVLRWSTDQLALIPYWFNTGRRATTAGEVFTPNLIPFITAQGGQTFNASMTISSTLPALRLFDTDSNNSVWLLHDNNSFYLQLRDASGNWVRDLMRISDGAAVAFFTSLRIVDDNMRMYRSADNELVIDNKVWNTIIGSYNNVYLAANCYFESNQWRRYDSSKGASLLVANASTKSIEFRTANAGTGNISWQSDTVWHTGMLRINNEIPEFLIGGSWRPVGMATLTPDGGAVQYQNTTTYTMTTAQAQNNWLLVGKFIPKGVGEVFIHAEFAGGFDEETTNGEGNPEIVPRYARLLVFQANGVAPYGSGGVNSGVIKPHWGLSWWHTLGTAIGRADDQYHQFIEFHAVKTDSSSSYQTAEGVVKIHRKEPVYFILVGDRTWSGSWPSGKTPSIRNITVGYLISG